MLFTMQYTVHILYCKYKTFFSLEVVRVVAVNSSPSHKHKIIYLNFIYLISLGKSVSATPLLTLPTLLFVLNIL